MAAVVENRTVAGKLQYRSFCAVHKIQSPWVPTQAVAQRNADGHNKKYH